MSKDALLAVIAEWLEEWEMPALVPRDAPDVQPENLKRILAVVGPRRAGKTYFMYQLIQALLSSGRYSKKQILFMDFEDYRLGEIGPDAMEEILVAFHRLAGQPRTFRSQLTPMQYFRTCYAGLRVEIKDSEGT